MPNADALDILRELNRFFYEDMRFAGNVNHYDDPHNSYLNIVLSRRLGIPISLAVLWLELGHSIGLKVHGVGFPGHFLVKLDLVYPQEGHVVIDPFSGESLSRDDLAERLIPYAVDQGYTHLELLPVADHSLVRTVDALSDSQYAEPSQLPGWSRAHVVAHLAEGGKLAETGPVELRCCLKRGENFLTETWAHRVTP